ncbi:MAG: hypothetical protein RSA66_09970 [Muribaculaceae bacterium]
MSNYTLIGTPIEAEGFNHDAICEIENIYNRFSNMYDCIEDELYAITAISIAMRNHTENTKAERCNVSITVWDVDLSIATTLEAEIRIVEEAINNYIADVVHTQTSRELIWRNLLLFCYQLNS